MTIICKSHNGSTKTNIYDLVIKNYLRSSLSFPCSDDEPFKILDSLCDDRFLPNIGVVAQFQEAKLTAINFGQQLKLQRRQSQLIRCHCCS